MDKTRSMKSVARVMVVAGGLVCVIIITVIALYLYGGLGFFIKLANRPVCEPTAEEYAVYSSFIDSFFSSDQPFRLDQQITPDSVVCIVDETVSYENFHPVPPLLGVNAFGPEEDFDQQNARAWPLQPRFHARMKWKLVKAGMMYRAGDFSADKQQLGIESGKFFQKGDISKWLPHPTIAGPFPENPALCGVLQLSRVGFDWQRRNAMLNYLYRCGRLCGQSGGGILLQKTGNNWQVRSWGSRLVY